MYKNYENYTSGFLEWPSQAHIRQVWTCLRFASVSASLRRDESTRQAVDQAGSLMPRHQREFGRRGNAALPAETKCFVPGVISDYLCAA
jgi:hypothetical protein